MLTWKLINSFPATLTSGGFNDSENTVAIKTMMLVYESMSMAIEQATEI
ncbi:MULTISPECIES: hypothetical protein [Bacteroides]|nr:hypothetical protein DW036_11190 [Bacteroides sp. AF39-11AC]